MPVSTPGQLPDRPVGPGRRADAGIGHTARPLPNADADSPIEAASPDRQQPMCYLVEVSVHRQSGVWQNAGLVSGGGRKPARRNGTKIV